MSTVKDAMEGCIGSIDNTATATQKTAAKKACKTTNAKKALKETLGSKSTDISEEDTEVYVRDAAGKSVADKMEACIKAAVEAGGTGKERENCVEEVKTHKKAITGDDTVSRVEVEELLKKGKDDKLADFAIACADSTSNANMQCDFKAKREEINGADESDEIEKAKPANEKALDAEMKTAKAETDAAKTIVKRARRACNRVKLAQSKTDAETEACINRKANKILAKMSRMSRRSTARKDFTVRVQAEAKQDKETEAQDYTRACMKGTGATKASCKTKTANFVKKTDPSFTEKDAEDALDRGAANSQGTVPEAVKGFFKAASNSDKVKQDEFQVNAETEAKNDAAAAYGRAARKTKADQDFEATKTASDAIMECGDAGKDATTCEGVGKKVFMEQKGAVAFTDGTSTGKVDAKKKAMVTQEWEDKKAEGTELAKGKKEGRKTRLKKLKQVEIEVEFPTSEANLDEATTEATIKAAMDTVKPAGATVTTKSATKYGVTSTKCAMRVKAALPESTADADVEKMATDFAAQTISGTTTRRSSVSGTVTGSAQSTTAEAYGAGGVSGLSASGVGLRTRPPGTLCFFILYWGVRHFLYA